MTVTAVTIGSDPAGISVVPAGPRGKGWLFGEGLPADTLGSDGDIYLDLLTYKSYGPKAEGTWVGVPIVDLRSESAGAEAAQDAAEAAAASAEADATQTAADRAQTAADRTATSTSAGEAAGSAAAASGSADAASDAAAIATTKAAEASGSADNAAASASGASGSASAAAASEQNAAQSESGAATAKTDAQAAAASAEDDAAQTAADRIQTGLDRAAAEQAAADAATFDPSSYYDKTESDDRYATAAQGAKADSAVQPGDLGNSASRDVGTGSGDVAAGNHSHGHFSQTNNPHSVTKAQVGLGNADNTSDTDKPVSSAQQSALDDKADASRNLTAGTGLTGGGTLAANRSFAIDKASAANVRSAASNKVLTADLIESASSPVALSDGSTVSVNWNSFITAEHTAAGNRTYGNPSNVQPGTTRIIRVVGDSATERTLSFASNYVGPLPEDTVTSTKGLLLSLFAYSSTEIHVTWKAFEL